MENVVRILSTQIEVHFSRIRTCTPDSSGIKPLRCLFNYVSVLSAELRGKVQRNPSLSKYDCRVETSSGSQCSEKGFNMAFCDLVTCDLKLLQCVGCYRKKAVTLGLYHLNTMQRVTF